MPMAPARTLPLAVAAALLLLSTPPAAGALEDRPGRGPSATRGPVGDTPAPTSPRWRAPVRGPLIIHRGFEAPIQRWSPGHRGVDLAATRGVPIVAAGSGRVVFAGNLAGRGVISIEHAPGVRTTYEPVRFVVEAGQYVALGAVIATFAPDRRHPNSLHWGLRIGNGYSDPLTLLRGRPSLKPR